MAMAASKSFGEIYGSWGQYFCHLTEGFQVYLASSHGRDAEAPTFQNQLRLNGVEGHHNDDCGTYIRRHNQSQRQGKAEPSGQDVTKF